MVIKQSKLSDFTQLYYLTTSATCTHTLTTPSIVHTWDAEASVNLEIFAWLLLLTDGTGHRVVKLWGDVVKLWGDVVKLWGDGSTKLSRGVMTQVLRKLNSLL